MAKFPTKSLPAPPEPTETIAMLAEPEAAPAQPPAPVQAEQPAIPKAPPHVAKLDGRSLRATGRNTQISTRITEHHKVLIYNLAKDHNLMISEVLELGAEALRDKLEGKG